MIANETLGCSFENYPGAGAAGGLGYAFKTFSNADLEPGISIIIDATKLDDAMKKDVASKNLKASVVQVFKLIKTFDR